MVLLPQADVGHWVCLRNLTRLDMGLGTHQGHGKPYTKKDTVLKLDSRRDNLQTPPS